MTEWNSCLMLAYCASASIRDFKVKAIGLLCCNKSIQAVFTCVSLVGDWEVSGSIASFEDKI